MGNGATALIAEPIPWMGQLYSMPLVLPLLAGIVLAPAR